MRPTRIRDFDMKKLLLFAMFIGFFAASCSHISYYQVARIERADNTTKDIDGNIVYEDTNILIYYDFWSVNGNMNLTLENKNDKNLVIHLDESFFIYNGYTYDYFQNRYFVSKEKSMTSTKTFATSLYSAYQTSIQVGESVIAKEKEKLIIPAKSKRVINEFNVLTSRYRSCDLLCDYMGSDGLDSITFTQENTPIAFENKIVYSVEGLDSKDIVSNKFYVSNITNCTDEVFMKTRTKKMCPDDDEYDREIEVVDYLFFAPNRCYITYVVTIEDGKH